MEPPGGGRALGQTDLYVCGFPCPTSSSAGKHSGVSTPYGHIRFHSLAFPPHVEPKAVVLENVVGLLKSHKRVLAFLVKQLRALQYVVHVRAINSNRFDLPQNRERLWIVAILESQQTHAFPFPTGWECPDLDRFIDPPPPKPVTLDSCPANSGKKINFIQSLKKIIVEYGKKTDPHAEPVRD